MVVMDIRKQFFANTFSFILYIYILNDKYYLFMCFILILRYVYIYYIILKFFKYIYLI